MAKKTARKSTRTVGVWIITIDGYPVEGTNSYSKRGAIAYFRGSAPEPWKYWRSNGYDVARLDFKKPA